jgi:hypothetical protein
MLTRTRQYAYILQRESFILVADLLCTGIVVWNHCIQYTHTHTHINAQMWVCVPAANGNDHYFLFIYTYIYIFFFSPARNDTGEFIRTYRHTYIHTRAQTRIHIRLRVCIKRSFYFFYIINVVIFCCHLGIPKLQPPPPLLYSPPFTFTGGNACVYNKTW